MVRHNINSSTELNIIIEKIRKDLKTARFGNYNSTLITGEGVLIAEAAENFISGQITSLGSTAGLIAIIMALLFLSWKAGIVVLIPNLLPVLLFFGLMGVGNIPLNVGTVMVAAVTIGIAVDDTTVFMVLYNKHLKEYGDEKRALKETLLAEIKPIFISSVSLAAGFSTLIFSKFVPIAQFGTPSKRLEKIGGAHPTEPDKLGVWQASWTYYYSGNNSTEIRMLPYFQKSRNPPPPSRWMTVRGDYNLVGVDLAVAGLSGAQIEEKNTT